MKLTNTMRDAFVRAALNDVPQRDYQEEIRALAVKAAVAAMPKELQAIWKNEKLRPWIVSEYVSMSNRAEVSWVSMYLPVQERNTFRHDNFAAYIPGISKEHAEQLEKLFDGMSVQEKTLHELKTKLKGAAYAVTTRKALAEMLPEFEKYLPADDTKANRSLPVVANLVAEFAKAGWPKDKKTANKAA